MRVVGRGHGMCLDKKLSKICTSDKYQNLGINQGFELYTIEMVKMANYIPTYFVIIQKKMGTSSLFHFILTMDFE